MNAPKINYLNVMAFLASTHFMIHVYTQLVPAILPTVKSDLGITLFQASLLLSVPMIVQVLGYIPIGIISDRAGSEVILISFLVTSVGAYVIATSNLLWSLMLGSGLLTLGSTMYHPPSLKASSMVEPSKMNLAMGVHLAGGSMGIATGPLTLGFLMPKYGWRFSFYIWIPLTLVISLFSYIYLKRHVSEVNVDKRKDSLMKGFQSIFSTGFILVMAAGSLMEIVVVNLSGFIPTFFQTVLGMSESLSSFVFGLGPLVGILGAFLGGGMGNILGIYKAAAANLVIITISLMLIPFLPSLFSILTVYVFYRGMVAAIMPLFNSMIAENSEMENRSLAFSVYFMMANIFGAFTPIITSILAEKYTLTVVFPMSVSILLPSIALIVYLHNRNKHPINIKPIL
jgi:FSR family fosmidomycin resistance protein-like MFS transporter